MDNNPIIRKLTETECLRLMGFNDDEIGRLKEATDGNKPMFSRTALYQFAGNSVVVDCYTAITREIIKDIERDESGRPRRNTLEAWL